MTELKQPLRVYLATPYSYNRKVAYKRANLISSILLKQGIHVLSPISHGHSITNQEGVLGEWEFWEQIDCGLIADWADEVWVITDDVEAMRNSLGVQGEIKFANISRKKVRFITTDLVKTFKNIREHFGC